MFQKKPLVFQPAGGKLSPMFDIEPQLVAIIINMGKIRQIISPTQGLELANSLIKGKHIENEIRELKKHNLFTSKNKGLCANGATLGVGCWRGFMVINSHLIYSKRGQKFSVEISN